MTYSCDLKKKPKHTKRTMHRTIVDIHEKKMSVYDLGKIF